MRLRPLSDVLYNLFVLLSVYGKLNSHTDPV